MLVDKMITIRTERMSDFFTKHYIEGLPIAAVFHQFSAIDRGDPHDHPWDFRSIILYGGYRETVFDPDTGASQIVDHHPGDSFFIQSGHIHRIVELFRNECWTIILPEGEQRTPGFYRFEADKTLHRYWHENEFSEWPR